MHFHSAGAVVTPHTTLSQPPSTPTSNAVDKSGKPVPRWVHYILMSIKTWEVPSGK